MKLAVLVAATAQAKASSWLKKEWEVQDAYFANEEIILSDPSIRSTKQWHNCGDKPSVPENGQDVKCYGAYCAAVCPIGWRSRGRWRIRCQADSTWSHSKFSPCITCPDMSEELKGTNAVVQNIFRKNLPVTQIFCGDSSNQLQIKDQLFKQGGKKKNIKCECKNGQNGDPTWKKSCNWSFKGELWLVQDVSTVTCRGKWYTPPKEKDPLDNEKRTTETINGIEYEAILFETRKPESENWAGSKKLCEDNGFELPVPDSDEMNTFLTNFAPSGVYGEIHLGIEMQASKPNEGYKFNNIYSNEAISYSNWHRHEPNDAKTGKSVVGMIVHNSGWHGKWYDFITTSKRGVQHRGRPIHHICMKKICKDGSCQKDPTVTPPEEKEKRVIETINGIKYETILFQNIEPETPNWAGSKKLCEDNGFRLPVPNSDVMNDFLVDFLVGTPANVYGEIHLGIYMEASGPNEDYKFNNVYSNEAISYANWHINEPNDSKAGRSVVGLIVHGAGSWHGKWYDFYTTSKRGVQHRGRPTHHICMREI